ncbi:hypothetical protein EG327_008362 [Venturia inaequalis]|uniref:Uncharacterized protein n=1 Tax=Venturia inaequalis TaxID=5025 RepID=A0A8H3ZB90_VENIN|nr:hypothetical protein EG327_008362 [Venturia inaequalis]
MRVQIAIGLLGFFVSNAASQATALLPFSIIGGLDAVTLTDCTGANNLANCGGTISVNGYTITIPKNTLVAFPAAFVPFKQLVAKFNTAGSGYAGLEVAIDGNVKNSVHIAGLFSISQFSLEINMGKIESLATNGAIKILNGPTIRINDPNAVYSAGYTLDPFFTADDENPSIIAFSGASMCVPRSATDAKCPQSNRPTGNDFFIPDVTKLVPFRIGDHLTFSGRKVGTEVICFEIVVENVQVRTRGTQSSFIRVEDAIIGVFTGDANAEMADTRFIGYFSDAAATASIFALDVDPCTGETERLVGNAGVRNGDIRNKWLWRADATTANQYTREYIIKSNGGQTQMTGNSIVVGQYVQPVTEWIMPEANVPGLELPSYPFEKFDHLVKGAGPFVAAEPDTIFGPLDPFPGATQPVATVCSVGNTDNLGEPVAAISPADQTLIAGSLVTLSGSNTNAALPNGNLVFTWTLVTGTLVAGVLKDATTPRASFIAPQVATAYTFSLNICVTGSATRCNTKTTTITVQTKASNAAVTDVVKVESFTWVSSQSGTISVSCRSNVVDGTASVMTLFATTLNGGSVSMVKATGDPGLFTYQSRSVKNPGSVSCTSNLGGTSGTQVATAKRRSVLKRAPGKNRH